MAAFDNVESGIWQPLVLEELAYGSLWYCRVWHMAAFGTVESGIWQPLVL
jgi:hypothetical protein